MVVSNIISNFVWPLRFLREKAESFTGKKEHYGRNDERFSPRGRLPH